MRAWKSAFLLVLCLLFLTACGTTTARRWEEESFSPDQVPAFSGLPYVTVHDNRPYFQPEEYMAGPFAQYSDLDRLDRCGPAFACLHRDAMPREERGSIGEVRPSGWHTVRYEGVDGNYLYNRCHLIAYQLAGENADPKNLITGTRYLNTKGMMPLENLVADYLEKTGNHVLYRATPVFAENDLLAKGVLLEACSLEDQGKGLCFNVFCYNVQPGVEINYRDGESRGREPSESAPPERDGQQYTPTAMPEGRYILNLSTMRFHLPNCPSATEMRPENRAGTDKSREELLENGYTPCGRCKP